MSDNNQLKLIVSLEGFDTYDGDNLASIIKQEIDTAVRAIVKKEITANKLKVELAVKQLVGKVFTADMVAKVAAKAIDLIIKELK